MSNSIVEDGTFVNSIVGEGTRLNGELDLNGLLRIDGDFSGTIRTNGKVLIGKNGRAKCTISASTVVVGGALRRNIYSTEKVIILSSGIIFGNIFTPRLIVEEGVILDGNCTIKSNYAEGIDLLKEPGIAAVSNNKTELKNNEHKNNEQKNNEQKIENSDSSLKAYSSTPNVKELDEKTLSENITRGPLL